MSHFDVVVCGLGVTGSAALYQLARRGVRTLGIERFAPGHDRGSSHGETRVIRLGYFEHPSYVPLVRRAAALWRDVEIEAARTLMHVTGIVEIGPPDGTLIAGTLASARLHDLPHETLAAPDLMQRFPAFRVPAELRRGRPTRRRLPRGKETSVSTLIALAQKAGAEASHRRGDPHHHAAERRRAHHHRSRNDRRRDRGRGRRPWLKTLLPDLPAPIRVTRQVLAWFAPVDPRAGRTRPAPGVPAAKPARNSLRLPGHRQRRQGRQASSRRSDRRSPRATTAWSRRRMKPSSAPPWRSTLPAADGQLIKATTCLYTMAPDGDFIIDRLPHAPQIVVASPCSGHGFKFAPVIGEILADLATTGATSHDIARFALARFRAAAT